VHSELPRAVHVTVTAQFEIVEHTGHVSAVPGTLYRPAEQVAHCELPLFEQVTVVAQPSMGAHAIIECKLQSGMQHEKNGILIRMGHVCAKQQTYLDHKEYHTTQPSRSKCK